MLQLVPRDFVYRIYFIICFNSKKTSWTYTKLLSAYEVLGGLLGEGGLILELDDRKKN